MLLKKQILYFIMTIISFGNKWKHNQKSVKHKQSV
jgi:hypothetical protein